MGNDAFLSRRHAQLGAHFDAERNRAIDEMTARYHEHGSNMTRGDVEALHFTRHEMATHSATGVPLPVDGSGCIGCGKGRNEYTTDESCGYNGESHNWADRQGDVENQPGDTVPYRNTKRRQAMRAED